MDDNDTKAKQDDQALLLEAYRLRVDAVQDALALWTRGLDARAACARIDRAINSPLDELPAPLTR
jgi:hypothetical protein